MLAGSASLPILHSIAIVVLFLSMYNRQVDYIKKCGSDMYIKDMIWGVLGVKLTLENRVCTYTVYT